MKNNTACTFLAALIAGSTLSIATAAPVETTRKSRSGESRLLNQRRAELVFSGTLTDDKGTVALNSVNRKWDRVTGTGTVNEAAVTPDGKVTSREANLTRNADGTITAVGTFTDFDGNTMNFSETTLRSPHGPVATGVLVGAEGETATYQTEAKKTGHGAFTRTTVITKADGTQQTRIETLAPSQMGE